MLVEHAVHYSLFSMIEGPSPTEVYVGAAIMGYGPVPDCLTVKSKTENKKTQIVIYLVIYLVWSPPGWRSVDVTLHNKAEDHRVKRNDP